MLTKRAEREVASLIEWAVMWGIPRIEASDRMRAFAERIAGKKPPKPKDPLAARELNAVIAFYKDLLSRRMRGEAPNVDYGEAVRTLRPLVRENGAQVVKARLFAFVMSHDEYYAKNGYALWLFKRNYNKIVLAEQAKGYRCSIHRPPCYDQAECTRRFLQEAS